MNILLIYQVKNWGRVCPIFMHKFRHGVCRYFTENWRLKRGIVFRFVLYLVRYVVWYVAWYISQSIICLSWSHFSSLDQWLFCCVGLICTWKVKRNFGWKNEQNFRILVSLETWGEFPPCGIPCTGHNTESGFSRFVCEYMFINSVYQSILFLWDVTLCHWVIRSSHFKAM